MPKNPKHKPRPRRTGKLSVDVAVVSSPSRQFLATIDGNHRDGDRIVGTNGIVWNVGKAAV
jgi:hypothetical protein